MSTQWFNGSNLILTNTQYGDSNWQTLSTNGDGDESWLRSVGANNTAAGLQTALGQAGNGDVNQNGGAVRPSMWVKAEIFD